MVDQLLVDAFLKHKKAKRDVLAVVQNLGLTRNDDPASFRAVSGAANELARPDLSDVPQAQPIDRSLDQGRIWTIAVQELLANRLDEVHIFPLSYMI